MINMPNENEDPLKRTMALIDEHKDKFSDGLYLEIATNMHKAWSDRARNLRSEETAANRETTRGTNTGDPGRRDLPTQLSLHRWPRRNHKLSLLLLAITKELRRIM